MVICIFYLSIHLFNQYLFTTYYVPNHKAKRRQFSALWCDICKEEIIIIIRFLDFFVFQTPTTRKQKRSFIDCHLSVFPEMSVFYFLLPGCSSFFCITRTSLNSWVVCLQLGNSFLTLKVDQVTQPNLSFFSHSICILLLFLSSVFSSPPVLPHTLFHPAPSQQGPVSHHQTHFYFWSPPSFISVTIIVFQLVSLLQYFHHCNTVFL